MAKSAPKPGSSARSITIAVVVAIVLLACCYIGWDLWNRRHATLSCGDGVRYAIDTRQFDTQYLAYSVKLEGSLNDKQKLSLNLDPVQQEKLSEAFMSANEFRKYLVAGFNACGITKDQYAQYGRRFQALDSLARQIGELVTKASRSPQENASLSALIAQYSQLAEQLGKD